MFIYPMVAMKCSHVAGKRSRTGTPETGGISDRKREIKKFKKTSTHLLIMEVDFCPVLCIAEMPILRAFVAFSHFVWYRRISSNELQMV